MNSFDLALGRVIAEQRGKAGLTQEALAGRAKLHPTYISQLERGLKSPTVRALIAICDGLELAASEAIRRAESRSHSRQLK